MPLGYKLLHRPDVARYIALLARRGFSCRAIAQRVTLRFAPFSITPQAISAWQRRHPDRWGKRGPRDR